jgi:hypothetical protein
MKKPLKIIGLSGKAGVGKDTIARLYLKRLEYLPIALADGVKEEAVARGLATYEEAFYTKPPEVRTALQQLGTELGREVYGEDYWCRKLAARLKSIHDRWGFRKFVITDVRFPNEVHFVQQALNGEVYRIYAPDRNAAMNLSVEQREHLSETALDPFDPILEGDKMRFGTTVVTVRNGKQIEEGLFDAVIDNRIDPPISLDTQITAILRAHDHIGPNEMALGLD